jgi:pimeloyl-ACP methyl ester carboxylesterase
MKSPYPQPKGFRRILRRGLFEAMILASSGCAHLATVKTTRPPLPVTSGEDQQAAKNYLGKAEHETPLIALGYDLSAAKRALHYLAQHPNDVSAQNMYNFSVARIVQNVEEAEVRPWQRPIDVNSDGQNYVLTTPKEIDPEHNPDRYELLPVDALRVGGRFFKSYSSVSGVGASLVAIGRTQTEHYRQQYKYRRVYAPVTATVDFPGREARLQFVDPLQTETTTLNKRVFPLAANFCAPTAVQVAREHPERLGLSRVINPGAYANTTMLCQLQRFDPARTPVIVVHGLQETGASWVPMIDSLRSDPSIRKHYQFWFYTYPSGYPYPYSAALFRRELDGINRVFPDHKRIILIGHSMGGMICRLMVTDAGDKIWHKYFGTMPDKTPLPSDTRKFLKEAFVFRHRSDVERVIFISTPHRGSDMAKSWIGRIGAGLVRTPPQFEPIYAATRPLLVVDPAVRPLKRMPNSVDTLEPNDRFVMAVNKLPIAQGIPYHSIMGDRGRGDTPNSSDGVVPYWSSHLEGAQSELVVNSNHGAQYNDQAIREVERILKTNLAHSNE